MNIGTKLLNRIDRIGNALPHPATLFLIFATLILILSWIGSLLGWSALHPSSGETIHVVNLLSTEGWHMIIERAVKNLSDFAPLRIVLVAVMGVGVAEHSGLIGAVTRSLVLRSPRKILTFMMVFTGIFSNIASDIGYVLLIPMAGAIYIALGRHPIIGMAAAFAGVSGGFSANILIGTIDPLLAGISTEAAQIVDPNYSVNPVANYYFMFVSTFVIAIAGTWVTERVIAPRFTNYNVPDHVEVEEIKPLNRLERKGLLWSLCSMFLMIGILLALALPEGAPLRGSDGRLLSSPLITGVITLLFVIASIMGIVYGAITKKYKSDADVYKGMVNSLKSIAAFIVLVFFAAQFVKYFEWSHLGLILAIHGASFLQSLNLHIIPLMIIFVLFTGVLNLFMGSASAKWAILAPILVPMFMLMGFSPELSQTVFRIGDSTTNIISPMMSFFALVITYFQKYDPKAGIGTLISTMLPYTLAFMVAWIALLILWIAMDWSLGPGAGLHYVSLISQ